MDASGVKLSKRPTMKRHLQEVIFNPIAFNPALQKLKFECDLPTWTFTWGSIDDWIPEPKVDGQILLKIPTELCLLVWLFGWCHHIPLIGSILKEYVTGAAGYLEYIKEGNWRLLLVAKTNTDEI